MSSLKRKKALYALGIGALVFANLVLFNMLSSRFFGRIDLTESKVYSLSPGTLKVLADLGEIVTIDVYFSENIPQELRQARQWMLDLLQEYESHGRGNVRVNIHDIRKQGLEEQLLAMGIQPSEFRVVERDKVEVAVYFMALAINSGDRMELAPEVSGMAGFEYTVTTSIYKVVHPERTIGIAGISDPEGMMAQQINLFQVYGVLERQLGELYSVRTFDIGFEPIPPEVSTLVLFTAYPYVDFVQGTIDIPMDEEGAQVQQIPYFDVVTSRFDDKALRKIDDFIASGGNLMVLHSPVQRYQCSSLRLPGCDTFAGFPVRSGLEDLLESWGVTLRQELIYTNDGLEITVGQPSFQVDMRTGQVISRQQQLKYGFWPRIGARYLNREHPVTRDLGDLALTWAAPVRIDEGLMAGREYSILLTTPDSYGIMTLGDPPKRFLPDMRTGQITLPAGESLKFDPQALTARDKDIRLPLAVLVQGVFPRYFSAEAPEPEPDELFTPAPKPEPIPPMVEPGRLLVLGAGEIFTNEYANPQQPQQGLNAPLLVLAANAVDYMELGQDLLELRTRRMLVKDRPWKEISDTAASLIKILLMLGLPLAAALFGFVRWSVRGRHKARYETGVRASIKSIENRIRTRAETDGGDQPR